MSEDALHRQLGRLLRKEKLDPDQAPDADQWKRLLQRMSRTFAQAERDRYTLERSLALGTAEMQALNDAVSEDRQRLEAILAGLPQAVFELDPELRVRTANRVARRLSGVDAGSLLLGSVTFRDAGGRVLRPAALRERVRVERFTVSDGSVLVDGRAIPASWELAPVRVDGTFAGAVCVITDLRELKTNEAALRQARVDAEVAVAAERARARFLANMSHELRTPLNAILGYTELVREELEPGAAVDDLGRVVESASYLLTLIDDLLDISEVDAGRLELVPETFAVDELLHQIAASGAPLVARANNTLTLQGCPGQVFQDRTRLAQALMNLVANAARFTRDGRITLSASIERCWLSIRVEDTGSGIEPERLVTLFEEFEQGDPRLAIHRHGSGLGLSLTRRFARLMGGRITATSQVDQGSVFTLEVPVRLMLDRR